MRGRHISSNLLDKVKRVTAIGWTGFLLALGIAVFGGLGIFVFLLVILGAVSADISSLGKYFASYSDMKYLALACGLSSVALGFIAIEMARKSDSRIAAMANLQLDERIAVMTDYGESAPEWMDMFYHTRAALHLQPWVSKQMKHDFKDAFLQVKQQAKSDKDMLLTEKLEDLWEQYAIDKW